METPINAKMPEELAKNHNVSRESIEKLETYVDLLLRWQTKFNLIGPDTVVDVWNRHISDSLRILPIFNKLMDKPAASFIDMGTGAGLPGVPLAIVSGKFAHLVESNGKKAAFLREAVRLTGIEAEIHQRRIEEIDSEALHPEVRLITARALAPLTKLITYCVPFMEKGATGLFMKGQYVDNELTEATKCWIMDVEKLIPDKTSEGSVLIIKNVQAKSKL